MAAGHARSVVVREGRAAAGVDAHRDEAELEIQERIGIVRPGCASDAEAERLAREVVGGESWRKWQEWLATEKAD